MDKYTLYYFNSRARAEIARLLFAIGDIPYEDVRFERPEWDSKYKEITPFGQCPYLEIVSPSGEVTQLCQSYAIARYIAKTIGLFNGSATENAIIDMMVYSVEDYIVQPCVYIRREQDEERKTEKRRIFTTEQLPQALTHLENATKRNNRKFMVLDKITLADVVFFHWIDWLPSGVEAEAPLSKYPKLHTIYKSVAKQRNVAKWIKQRPDTEL